MISVFQLPNGELVTDRRVPLPDRNSVKWCREYPVDGAKSAYRVAPVFNHVRAAVKWLESIVEERRQRTTTQIPRVRLEDLGLAFGTKHEFENRLPGVGVTHQYEGYLEFKGHRLPVLLFRGDRSSDYPLIPTLSRCLWPALIEKKIPRADALKALQAEETCTSYFVNKFFSDRNVRAKFPWVENLNLAYRAAIARHYGFSSWLLDFTVDPAIAAFFATGAGGQPPEKGSWGSIWVIDESYLEELLGQKPLITLHPGYETRSWLWIDIEKIRGNGGKGLEELKINRVGAPDFWALQTGELREGFCLSHHYAPGVEVERMWQQKWCGVEPFPPIGKVPFMLRLLLRLFKAGRNIGNPSLKYILNSQCLFQRLCSRVYFVQSGELFEMPDRGIMASKLLWPNDEFKMCVDAYINSHNLAPGAAIRALLSQFKG